MCDSTWSSFALVLAGGLIGLLTNWFTHYLSNKRQGGLDQKRKKLLKVMLENPKYEWRSLATLSHTIGADESTTMSLLLEMDARASQDGQKKWGLISRVNLPDTQ